MVAHTREALIFHYQARAVHLRDDDAALTIGGALRPARRGSSPRGRNEVVSD